MSIHHIALEVDSSRIAEELEFWSFLGLGPVGLRRVGRGEPVIHWLTGGDHNFAVELLPVDLPKLGSLSHLALSVPDRRLEIASRAEAFGHRCELDSSQFDFGQRLFLQSPTGHLVEAFTNSKALKAGPPLQD